MEKKFLEYDQQQMIDKFGAEKHERISVYEFYWTGMPDQPDRRQSRILFQ